MTRVCRVEEIGGVPVRVQTDGRSLSDGDRAALAELVDAVRRKVDAEPADVRAEREQRQAAALERIRARNARLSREPSDAR